jgi:hypothetical protein
MQKKSNPKDVKKGCLILSVLLVLIISIAVITCESEPDIQLSEQELRDQKINDLLYGNGMKAVNIQLKRP